VAASVAMFGLVGSPRYPFREAFLRETAGLSYDRGYNPMGQRRQLGAVAAQLNRSRDLTAVAVPTVVVHGLDDPLVGYSGGIALARAIPQARFVGFPGMGHDLPEALWPDFVEEIARVAGRSVAAPAASGAPAAAASAATA
jgi:pimeloyl-ACP methyl ester carboxylesterase